MSVWKSGTVSTVLLTMSLAAHASDELVVTKAASAPAVDGMMDSTWNDAAPLKVKVTRIPEGLVQVNKEKQTGKYAKHWSSTRYTGDGEVELRALYTDGEIYILARWKDDSKDDQHKPWHWEGDKKDGEYKAGPEREDRIAMSFPISGTFVSNMLLSVDSVMDVWHWKAGRTNPAGMAHDKSHIISTSRPTGTSAQHYDAEGKEVFISRPGDGGVSPYKSAKVDPFTYEGDIVAKYISYKPDNADATDISAKGVWKDGYWTVELARKLDTGHHDTDAVFDPAKGSKMALAIFNSVGDHFHASSGTITVTFK